MKAMNVFLWLFRVLLLCAKKTQIEIQLNLNVPICTQITCLYVNIGLDMWFTHTFSTQPVFLIDESMLFYGNPICVFLMLVLYGTCKILDFSMPIHLFPLFNARKSNTR